jgi:hypothetical protein
MSDLTSNNIIIEHEKVDLEPLLSRVLKKTPNESVNISF